MSRMSEDLSKIYVSVGVPLLLFTTTVGFFSGIIGELNDNDLHGPNSAITSCINITGCTFLGIVSGVFWPYTMPVISVMAIYNKYNRPKTNK
jgi:hypothetical protein